MSWLLIETPPKVRAIALNTAEQRRTLAEQAHGCVRWLKSQGFDVVRVEKGAVGPRIIIRTSPLCKQLDGTISSYSRTINGEYRYSFTFRMECEVRWLEAEAAPAKTGGAV